MPKRSGQRRGLSESAAVTAATTFYQLGFADIIQSLSEWLPIDVLLSSTHAHIRVRDRFGPYDDAERRRFLFQTFVASNPVSQSGSTFHETGSKLVRLASY